MSGKRIRGLKARMGCGDALAEGGQMARLSNEGIPAGGVQGGSHSAGRCGISKKRREGSSRSESCQEF